MDDVSLQAAAEPLREWTVVSLGIALFAVSGGILLVSDIRTVAVLIQFTIPLASSLLLVALGLWLQVDGVTGDQVVVSLWSLGGGIVLGLAAGWSALLQAMQGNPPRNLVFAALSEAAIGSFGGALLGIYYSRLQHRTAELAEQKNRLDEFASIVSHDLRNPMNVAQGQLELARETGDDDHFEAVERAHDRMERLIEEILSLARRGETVQSPTTVAIEGVARRAWRTVETPGMELRVRTDRRIVSDGRRLRGLFENLFRNAAEHGGDVVTIGELDDGFYVEDDGPGIPEPDRERVFEGGYSTNPDGTGFGLAIVRRVAEAHGWRVAVTDGTEGGARFVFTEVTDA